MSQQQIEYACKDLVFHFNKKHLEDETIPMWVVKTHGETFYVDHVSADIAWSTKETPNNSHTKGSIKFKIVSYEKWNHPCNACFFVIKCFCKVEGEGAFVWQNSIKYMTSKRIGFFRLNNFF